MDARDCGCAAVQDIPQDADRTDFVLGKPWYAGRVRAALLGLQRANPVQPRHQSTGYIMILTGTEILREHKRQKIKIDPFDPARATTNSYDLTLGHDFIRYREAVIDPRKNNAYE